MPETLLQNRYKVSMQRQNRFLKNLERKYAEGIQTQQGWLKIC